LICLFNIVWQSDLSHSGTMWHRLSQPSVTVWCRRQAGSKLRWDCGTVIHNETSIRQQVEVLLWHFHPPSNLKTCR
jgi:hypothetical protein